ncbi:aspartate racemase [candidate division WOR_3 bacterium SM23_42]|uniref:Aspartate racemase n=1 Tax=candidate division WOR_3 bacterium SM23_42 TaxID=1703779 RepID=A0A0S8FVI7_UNCW3|nr:MAG: aspartate racemase [candidate division WOR_3 bacterium SM23_42]
MKKIGIVGGLGPEATVDYYREIIDSYRKQSHGDAPEIIIYSLNLQDFPAIREREKIAKWLAGALESLDKAGADFAVLSANTPHIVFDELESLSPIPLLSIVEETCRVVKGMHLKKVGLMGTKVTMSANFYQRIFSREDITLVVPTSKEQDYINKKLFSEILYNRIIEETHRGLLAIVKRMIDEDAIEGLVLGCTELPLILTKDEFGIPFFNTTRIHAESAVRYCLSGR